MSKFSKFKSIEKKYLIEMMEDIEPTFTDDGSYDAETMYYRGYKQAFADVMKIIENKFLPSPLVSDKLKIQKKI